MSRDFLPTHDSDLLAWSAGFSALIVATPTAFGLTAPMSVAYQELHEAFANALEVATNPATRTRAAVACKRQTRTPLALEARKLARIINAHPGIDNDQRLLLGLNPRKGESTPINPPDEPPVLEVVSSLGRTLRVRLHAVDTTRRGKPDGVDGATILAFVGEAPPADMSLWKFAGSTTRQLFDVEFEPTVEAGARVFLCAFWFSPRKESGPACLPISAYLSGGVTAAKAA